MSSASKLAAAKQRAAANAAKKAKAVAKPKLVSTPKVVSKSMSQPDALAGIRALNAKNAGKAWSPEDVALLRKYQSNPAGNEQALAYQATQKQNIAQTEKENKIASSKPSKPKSSSNSRDLASRALSMSGPVNPYQHPTIPGADVADPFNVGARSKDTLSQGKGQSFGGKIGDMFSSIFGSLGKNAYKSGSLMASPNINTPDDQRAMNIASTFGVPSSMATGEDEMSALGRALQEESTPDIPTGYGDSGQIYYNNYDPAQDRVENPAPTIIDTPYQGNPSGNFPIGESVDSKTAERRRNAARGKNIGPWAKGYGSQNDYGQESVFSSPIAPVAPEVPAWTESGYQSPTGSTPRTYGSGAFATGKGVGNPADQDPYMKELRKALKGYSSAEDDIRGQFEDLIRALDPTYDQYQKEGKQSLDEQQAEDLNKLASVMIAGNVGDSEQRAQAMQRTQGQYANTFSNLLAKLAAQKNQDISGYKEKSIGAINDVRSQAQSARERIAQLMRDAQEKAWEQSYKMAQLGRSGGGSGGGLTPNQRQIAIKALLTEAAQAPGGREWLQNVAPYRGVSAEEVLPFTANDNWEARYNRNWGVPAGVTDKNVKDMTDEELARIVYGG